MWNYISCEMLSCIAANKKLQNMNDKLIADGEQPFDNTSFDVELLQQMHNDNMRRIDSIEDKAKGMIGMITLVITLLSAGIGIVFPYASSLMKPILISITVLWFFTVLYYFFGGLYILQAYSVCKRYIISLDNLLELSRSENQQLDHMNLLQHCIRLNTNVLLIKSNAIMVGMNCIRNGLVCCICVSLIIALAAFLPKTADTLEVAIMERTTSCIPAYIGLQPGSIKINHPTPTYS